MKIIDIIGGAGFIGSHIVHLFVNKSPEYNIINLDNEVWMNTITSGEYDYYEDM